MQRQSLRAGALGAALLTAMATAALADVKDYEFQLGKLTMAGDRALSLSAKVQDVENKLIVKATP